MVKTMEKMSLKGQIICFVITLILLLIFLFAIKTMDWIDYLLIALCISELVVIMMTVMKKKQ